jgi:nucleoside-diphosphate-sugar epimerase
MATAVIFGGAGFIGTHLAETLRGRQDYSRVVSVDIKTASSPVPGVDYLMGDVREPLALPAFDGDIDIFNLAAVHTTPGHEDNEYFWTNVNGALNVCAFADSVGCKRILFTSSISVYGPSEAPIDESSPLRPTSAYGMSKSQAERIHRNWQASAPGRKLVIARPAVIFGRGEGGNFTRLAASLKRGIFFYAGRRDTIKGCCYVDDIVGSLLYMRDLDHDSVTYNGAYPDAYTIEDICNTMAATCNYSRPRATIPLSLMLFAGYLFELAGKIGLRTSINRARVMKIVQSTNIRPVKLVESRYPFQFDLARALRHWKEHSPSGELE